MSLSFPNSNPNFPNYSNTERSVIEIPLNKKLISNYTFGSESTQLSNVNISKNDDKVFNSNSNFPIINENQEADYQDALVKEVLSGILDSSSNDFSSNKSENSKSSDIVYNIAQIREKEMEEIRKRKRSDEEETNDLTEEVVYSLLYHDITESTYNISTKNNTDNVEEEVEIRVLETPKISSTTVDLKPYCLESNKKIKIDHNSNDDYNKDNKENEDKDVIEKQKAEQSIFHQAKNNLYSRSDNFEVILVKEVKFGEKDKNSKIHNEKKPITRGNKLKSRRLTKDESSKNNYFVNSGNNGNVDVDVKYQNKEFKSYNNSKRGSFLSKLSKNSDKENDNSNIINQNYSIKDKAKGNNKSNIASSSFFNIKNSKNNNTIVNEKSSIPHNKLSNKANKGSPILALENNKKDKDILSLSELSITNNKSKNSNNSNNINNSSIDNQDKLIVNKTTKLHTYHQLKNNNIIHNNNNMIINHSYLNSNANNINANTNINFNVNLPDNSNYFSNYNTNNQINYQANINNKNNNQINECKPSFTNNNTNINYINNNTNINNTRIPYNIHNNTMQIPQNINMMTNISNPTYSNPLNPQSYIQNSQNVPYKLTQTFPYQSSFNNNINNINYNINSNKVFYPQQNNIYSNNMMIMNNSNLGNLSTINTFNNTTNNTNYSNYSSIPTYQTNNPINYNQQYFNNNINNNMIYHHTTSN